MDARAPYQRIKLVASDMDGTMLDPEGELPQETFELVDRLHDAGIRFVAASGRRFDTLQAQFAPVADRIDFVAANGAQVVVDGRLIDREVFSHAAVRRLAHAVDLFDTLHLALFDDTRSYLLDDESAFERELDKNLPMPVRMHDVPSPEVNIIKASVYCDEGVMDMAYALTRRLGASAARPRRCFRRSRWSPRALAGSARSCPPRAAPHARCRRSREPPYG